VIVGSMVTWALTKRHARAYETCYAARFGFYAPNQIVNMSLNGLRRRVATHDKTQTKTQMDEPSVALDLGALGFN
jgi:hypothetical protein